MEFPAFVLLGVYSPANRDASRDDFRVGFFDALDVRVRNLIAEGKQVVLTGDLNVSRSEIDSTNVTESLRKEGVSLDDWMAMPVRRIFNQLVFEGYVKGARDAGREEPVLWDLCRSYHPERLGMNTCWDTKRNTRPANNGSRIDYILCSDGIRPWWTSADVQQGLMGSDHCPVYAILADAVSRGAQTVPLAELMNPPSMFNQGRRIREWQRADLLPLSAKLLPGFDRRQSIRDMFTKKAGPSTLAHPSPPSWPTSVSVVKSIGAERTAPTVTGTTQQPCDNGTPHSAIVPETLGRGHSSGLAAPVESSPPTKRPAGAIPSLSRPQKRGKVESRKNSPGQMTLQGFFTPTSVTTPKTAHSSNPDSTKPGLGLDQSNNNSAALPHRNGAEKKTSLNPPPELSASSDMFSEKVFDAVESKDQWSKLLKKREAPRCEHGEPCISLTTKKPGVNCGTFLAHPLLLFSLTLPFTLLHPKQCEQCLPRC